MEITTAITIMMRQPNSNFSWRPFLQRYITWDMLNAPYTMRRGIVMRLNNFSRIIHYAPLSMQKILLYLQDKFLRLIEAGNI